MHRPDGPPRSDHKPLAPDAATNEPVLQAKKMSHPLRPRHQAHPHASSPPSRIDDAEFDAILEQAADTLARHGWSAHRIAAQLGISVRAAERAVHSAGPRRSNTG